MALIPTQNILRIPPGVHDRISNMDGHGRTIRGIPERRRRGSKTAQVFVEMQLGRVNTAPQISGVQNGLVVPVTRFPRSQIDQPVRPSSRAARQPLNEMSQRLEIDADPTLPGNPVQVVFVRNEVPGRR